MPMAMSPSPRKRIKLESQAMLQPTPSRVVEPPAQAAALDQGIELHNGVLMPAIGLGTYKMTAADAKHAVSTALKLGYRLVDTAAAYTNERAVGLLWRLLVYRATKSSSPRR